jgi:hypothetical protein
MQCDAPMDAQVRMCIVPRYQGDSSDDFEHQFEELPIERNKSRVLG